MSTTAGDLFALMWAPFLMCLVLTGIHAYLSVHVIAREVVFVDIALAQIAALGAAAALLLDLPLDSSVAYAAGLGATLVGAAVLALTRTRERRLSQEAVIGVVYAVSAAAAVLLVDRAPHGAEHLRQMLVGSILAVTPADVARVAVLYALVGAFHWVCRRPFFLISTDPEAAFREGWRVRLWDFLFCASFGLVVTSSVRVAGVLLVFSYLIVPALAAIVLGGTMATRLVVGWAFGALVSLLGVLASALLDLPTGATVACTFGVAILVWSGLVRLLRPPRPIHNGGINMTTRILSALVMLAVLLVPGASAYADKPLVVASFYPLYEFSRQVAGDHAEVISLVPPGVEPHDWEPAPQDVVRLQKAKLFVYNGAGLEPWVEKLLRDAKAKGVLAVKATERVALLTGEGHGHEHAQEAKGGVKPKGDTHAVDPHVWLDPVRAQTQVEAIRAGLAKVDPANAATYTANAQAYRSKLAALDAAFASGLKQCARREVVTTHSAFAYLTRRYGLTQISISGLEPESEPSPADLVALVKQVKERKVRYVFFETLVSPKLAETLAREVGAKTLALNPIEGLTKEEQAAGKTYVSLMEENLRNLRTALDCK